MAGFLGSANIFDAEVLDVSASAAVCSALDARLGAAVDESVRPGPAAIVIRPERIKLQARGAPVEQGHNAIRGTVTQVVYLGACTHVHVDVGAPAPLVVEVPNASGPGSVSHAPGATVDCICTHDAVRVLHRSTASPITDPVIDEANALSAT